MRCLCLAHQLRLLFHSVWAYHDASLMDHLRGKKHKKKLGSSSVLTSPGSEEGGSPVWQPPSSLLPPWKNVGKGNCCYVYHGLTALCCHESRGSSIHSTCVTHNVSRCHLYRTLSILPRRTSHKTETRSTTEECVYSFRAFWQEKESVQDEATLSAASCGLATTCSLLPDSLREDPRRLRTGSVFFLRGYW